MLAVGALPSPAAAPGEAGSPAHRRAGLVDVKRFAPGARLDIRYATRRNVTGRRLPGYCRAWALMRRARPGTSGACNVCCAGAA